MKEDGEGKERDEKGSKWESTVFEGRVEGVNKELRYGGERKMKEDGEGRKEEKGSQWGSNIQA